MEDEAGIFIRVGTRKYRPGPIVGHENLPMDDGGVKLRQVVRFSPAYHQEHGLVSVVTPQGQRVWSGLPADHEHRLQKTVDNV